VNTAYQPVSNRDTLPLRNRSRLAFNEQLCFFASGSDAISGEQSFGWWAALALVLAVLPWALVGLGIWMLA
jgi:hypothetical protein